MKRRGLENPEEKHPNNMRKLTHQEILDRQKNNKDKPKIPLTVILDNIRSLHNVGSIFRTADGAGVEKIWLCGITGYPPHPQIEKTAIGAQDSVDWDYSKDTYSVACDLKNKGYKIVLLEQADESIDYYDFIPDSPICLIVGNEIEGTSDQMLPICDAVVDISMKGVKNSLNVSVAFGVVAYHFSHHLQSSKMQKSL